MAPAQLASSAPLPMPPGPATRPAVLAQTQSIPPGVGPHSVASPPTVAAGVAPVSQVWSTRLLDLLDLVRHEFEVIGNDAVHFKGQRDDMEHRGAFLLTVAQQFNEVGMMQEHIYELEKRHYEIVAHYEDEIARLHALLESRGGHAEATAPHPVMERDAPPRPAHPPLEPLRAPKRPKVNPTDAPASNPEVEPESRVPADSRPAPEVNAQSVQSAPNAPSVQEGTNAPPQSTAQDVQHAEGSQPNEEKDWAVVYNPNTQPQLEVNLIHTLTHDSVVCCVRLSPDGKLLATGCNRTAQIYDTATGKLVRVLQDKQTQTQGDLYIRSVCFSPDGSVLATGAEDRQIRIWDIEAGEIKSVFSGHKQEIYALEFSRDGKTLASGSGDKTVRIWDVESGTERHILYTSPGLDYGPGVTSISISPDGRLVAAGALDTFVRLWDTSTGKLKGRLKGHKDSIYSVCFSPDGKTLVSGSLDKTIKVWDMSSTIKTLEVNDDDVQTPSSCIATFVGHKDYVLSVSCSPQGDWIASGSKDRCVQFWDPKTNQTQLVLQGHKNSGA